MCVKKVKEKKNSLLTLGSTFSCQQVKRPFGFCQHSLLRKVKALETWLTRISKPCDPGQREEPYGNNRKRGKACLGKQGKGFFPVHDNGKKWRMRECSRESHSKSLRAHYLNIVFWWCLSFEWKMQLQWVKNKLAFFVRERSWRSSFVNVLGQCQCFWTDRMFCAQDGLNDEDKSQSVAYPDR